MPHHLTDLDQQVLALVEAGYSNKSIARQLRRTQRTAEWHVSRLLLLFGAASRTELVHLARRQGWFSR